MLPNEQQAKQRVSSELADHLRLAKQMLNHWLVAEKDTAIEQSPLADVVINVVTCMSVKAARQLKSVIVLCEHGEGSVAATICRDMFETAAVVGFVLKPRFTPRKSDRKGNVIKRLDTGGVSMTREFRATLYVAHQVLEPERRAQTHAERPGMRRLAKKMAKVATDPAAQFYKNRIGSHWTNTLLSHPFTYSGLSISNLARSLSGKRKIYAGWYDKVYGPQSEIVHANDASNYVDMRDGAPATAVWHDNLDRVRRALQTAMSMFVLTVGRMMEFIEFGPALNDSFSKLMNEYAEMIE